MTGQAVTFDFHDTLAHCDRWFELEVRDLVPAFLQWRGGARSDPPTPALLDAARVGYRRLRQRIAEEGHEQPAEACVASVLGELGILVSPVEIGDGVAALMRETLDEVRAIPGAATTVRELAAAGVPLGVVSSAVYHPFVEWSLTQIGLRQPFAVVVTSASAGYYKSRPEIYRHALDALHATPERSIHVGDSYRYDVQGAHRAGMRTVWLRGERDDEPDGRAPDLTTGDLQGLAPRLLAMLAAGD